MATKPKMSELQADPNRKPLKRREGAVDASMRGLAATLDFMNNPEISGAVVPPGVDPKADLKNPPPVQSLGPTGAQGMASPAGSPGHGFLDEPPNGPHDTGVIVNVAAPPPVSNQKFMLTGRLNVGKDYVANAAGLTVFGFSQPLYDIANYFFPGRNIGPNSGKEVPGVRQLLQAIGNYGRGDCDEKYPLTPARALFEDAIRTKGVAGEFGTESEVDWATFGLDPNIWLTACIKRVDRFLAANPDARVAITNVRFANEFNALKAAGWEHYHVQCSAATWAQRLAKSKLTPQSPQVADSSEKLAANFDAGVIKQISAQKVGQILRVIWSDTVPAPSIRLHSVSSWLSHINAVKPLAATPTSDEY